ncbi:hypothetical protein HWC34_gp22 [Microbacterium phage Alex44]|uniref:Uncharacterized protein n=1 Tax=Microbacterium phage Alex44 TaxID=2590877 RepID=A0A4Y6EBY4_9CAUD|nr:hypothetical protein HWC34_gp22 [Microbacterium phage Alex44]QDF15932.1 hypothetical protein SEA_ALEX44_22 [Microbacterium phage Alex44]
MDSPNFTVESVPHKTQMPNIPASYYDEGTIVRLTTGERYQVASSQRDGKYWLRLHENVAFPIPQRDQ